MSRFFTKQRAMSRLATILMIVALLFVGHAGASAMVLCVGLDGHFDVEASSADVCTTQAETKQADAHIGREGCWGRGGGDQCGPCLDFPIAAGGMDSCHPATQVSKTGIQVPSAFVTVLPANFVISSDAVGGAQEALVPTALSLLSTRTVSLRI